MMPPEIDSPDLLIRQNSSFAIYRLPGETMVRFVTNKQDSPVDLLHHYHDLDGRKGFVIAPFSVSDQSPIILIPPDSIASREYSPTNTSNDPVGNNIRPLPKASESYSRYFESFIKQLQSSPFDKLVLSHPLNIKHSVDFSPAKAFFEACIRYPQCFVYLCHTPYSGTWLGSTPETLLSGSKNQWKTVSLAGTQNGDSFNNLAAWDAKNLEEQEMVSKYIRKQLNDFGAICDKGSEKGPYPIQSGNLLHLKTEFNFLINDTAKLGQLLEFLHPTPAVCGSPKEEAYRFIIDHEGYDRRYYSGFIGMLDPDNVTDIYVNLRCMNIGEEELCLYAGGGLLSSSTLDSEIKEWKDKLQTMLVLIR